MMQSYSHERWKSTTREGRGVSHLEPAPSGVEITLDYDKTHSKVFALCLLEPLTC